MVRIKVKFYNNRNTTMESSYDENKSNTQINEMVWIPFGTW